MPIVIRAVSVIVLMLIALTAGVIALTITDPSPFPRPRFRGHVRARQRGLVGAARIRGRVRPAATRQWSPAAGAPA